MSQFSSGLKLSGLDDYIQPSQACIKPEIIQSTNKRAKIDVRNDGTYIEYEDDGTGKILESAKISLTDCLACSGCITSAESVLITSQGVQEFLDNIKPERTVVVSISPQSRASIAARFKLTSLQTHKKLITLFKSLGVHYIFDTSFSRHFSLMESAAEFVARYRKTLDAPLPMLASACPGWVCYAEKTHGDFVLPYISSTKSPQQIMGTIVKNYFAKQLNITPDKIYHASVMPCYDKKLEASREDFYNDIYKTRDVDLVLTSGEILDIISQKNIDFKTLEESPLDKLFTNITDEGQLFGVSGGSGGYIEYIFRYAAKELFGVTVDKLEYKNVRGTDHQSLTLEVDGKPVLQFATAYGFKHIQNFVRNIKQKKQSPFHFIEVMACPSGCLNGGGQIKQQEGESSKELLKRVEDIYNEQILQNPEQDFRVKELYNLWFNGPFSADSKTHLHTQYHGREKLTNPLAIKW